MVLQLEAVLHQHDQSSTGHGTDCTLPDMVITATLHLQAWQALCVPEQSLLTSAAL